MDAWLWTGEEEPPFQGLPPLPKVFREPHSSPLPSLLPPGKAEEEEIQLVDRHGASLQEKITWVHHEMVLKSGFRVDLIKGLHNGVFRHLQDLDLQENPISKIWIFDCVGKKGVSLRKVDLALFSQLYHLALEIQDLKELQQEMEIFSEEHGFSQNHGAPGDPNSATAFELTI